MSTQQTTEHDNAPAEALFQLTPAALRRASQDELLSSLTAMQLWRTEAERKGRDFSSYLTGAASIVLELENRSMVVPELPIVREVIRKEAGTYAAFRVAADSAKQLAEWCQSQGICNVVPPDKMHCTTVHSEVAVPQYVPSDQQPELDPSCYEMGILGDDHALVLYFSDATIEAQHAAALEMGAAWSYSSFKPHITLSYDCTGSTFKGCPDFPIRFESEYVDELRTEWAVEEGLRAPSDMGNQVEMAAIKQDQFEDVRRQWDEAVALQMKAIREPLMFTEADRNKQLELMISAWVLVPATMSSVWYPMTDAVETVKALKAGATYGTSATAEGESIGAVKEHYVLHIMEAVQHALMAVMGEGHSGLSKKEFVCSVDAGHVLLKLKDSDELLQLLSTD